MRKYVEKLVEIPVYICDRCGVEIGENAPISIYADTSELDYYDYMEYHFCCKECFISFIRSPEVERLIEYASYEKSSFISKSLTIKLKNPERILLEKLLREDKK